jgi:hypothetical protein
MVGGLQLPHQQHIRCTCRGLGCSSQMVGHCAGLQVCWLANVVLSHAAAVGRMRVYPVSQVGHALVSTAVARLLQGSDSIQKLSIIPRTGLVFSYCCHGLLRA